MKVTIAINNYNYSKFLKDCVDSVLEQTYRNIEIIIIDDGSTDDSIELLNLYYMQNNIVKIIQKKNGGQLSAFNETIKYVEGEIICFLDADDLYKKNYIEEIVDIYKDKKDIDFIYCAMERFFDNGKTEVIKKYPSDKELGFSVISSLYGKEWVGSETSTISMRTELFKKIVPIPFEEDWVTRADDCLVWGSSIFGAKKYYCSQVLIKYRVHGNNFYYGKKFSNEYLYKRELNINRLFNFFKSNALMNNDIINLISLEYSTRDTRDIKIFFFFFKILFNSHMSFIQKLKRFCKLLIIFLIPKLKLGNEKKI